MAEAAVSFLMENMKQILTHHYRRISRGEIELPQLVDNVALRQLMDDVALLKAYLLDAAMKPENSAWATALQRQIREAVYDVEDTIDACLSKEATAKTKNFFRRHLDKRLISLSKEVKSISRTRVDPILDKIKKYGFIQTVDAQSTSREEPWTERKKDPEIARGDDVVGFEDEAKTIIGYLMEEKTKLDVISITGMPGLGKTTLARKIYEDMRIEFDFPYRIWISVSQKFNKKGLLLNILQNFTNRDVSNLSHDELSRMISAFLKENRFFLILDDVCSLDDWEFIRYILPKSNSKGKVLVTSRDNNVGVRASFYRKPHKLRFLTNNESWTLLQLEFFGNLRDCPPELEEIGKIIAKKCDGLPLLIVAVGGILPTRLRREEWARVSESMKVNFHTKKNVSSGMELTYSGLPNVLRECFLYMGVFPENYEISIWTLIRLWIAEGLVQRMEGKSLEDVATDYLNDLISRNLVMSCRINTDDEVKTCRVHYMIRSFCVQKAQEQNFFHVMKRSNGVLEPPVNELRTFRRLSIHSGSERLLSQVPESQRVRSFLCFDEEHTELDPRYTSAIPDAFNLLKVWESKSLEFHEFPQGITRLFHLRYITLSINHLSVLPETLSELWNLQTLVIETTSRLITIKADIWRLIQLRHLKTNASIVLSSKGKGKAGENLQTLDSLTPESCTEQVADRAQNLTALGIRGNLELLFGKRFLEKFNRLEKLKLLNVLVNDAASENPLGGLFHDKLFPPNLKSLTLSNTFINWKHMSTLANITSLEVLKLKENAFTGIIWDAVGDHFPCLRFLLISNTNLFEWKVSPSSFPRLRHLALKKCDNLSEIPLILLNALEILDMDRVRKSAVESAMGIAEAKKNASAKTKISYQ